MKRALVVVVLLVSLVAPAGAAVADDPRFEIRVSDDRVRAGGTERVTMILTNDAADPDDVVPTARAVDVSVEGDGPIDVVTETQLIGNITDGEARAFDVVLDVPERTPAGTYRLPVRVTYSTDDGRESTTVFAAVRVRAAGPDLEDPRFELSVPEPELRPGATQQLTIELRNDDEDRDDTVETATDVEVTVNGTGPIEVDSGPRTLGDVPDGVPQPVTVTVDVPTDAPGGSYRLPVRVEYGDADGDDEDPATLHATVRVDRRARFAVETNRTTARVGGDGSLFVDVTNTGERRANAARLTLTADSPVLGFEGAPAASRFLDGLDPGETQTVAFDLSVGESAALSNYSLDATVTYRTTDGASARSRTLTTGLAPLPEQTFSIAHRNDSIRVGQEGTVGLTVTNDGPDPVRNAVVTLATTGAVTPLEPEVAIGDLEPGEATDVTFDVRATPEATNGSRQFEARVRYRDADDEVRTGDAADVPVRIRPERSFAASLAAAGLRAGQEGTVTVRVTNRGPGAARDAVVRLATGNRDLTLLESEVALGRLPAGATREVSFDVEVTDDAAAGSRQLDATVSYRTADGAERTSDPMAVQADVARSRPDFQIETGDATVAPGGTAVVNVTVTNRRGEPVEDVSAKLFTDTPLSSSIGEGFLDRLGANESATIRFEISADESAIVANSYPLEIDFQFDTPDGDTLISDTYRAPVRIEAAERERGGGLPVVPIVAGLALVVLVVAGVILYRRREE
jgi:hypothetical protein